MLYTISILTSVVFATTYPLCFWISADDPLKNKFHRFHLGLPNFVGGVAMVFVLISNVPMNIKVAVVLWKAVYFGVTQFYWRKETPNPFVITFTCLLGLVAFCMLHGHYISSKPLAIAISILSGLIFSAALYAMNLGHWYLNVHGLPLSHLMRANTVFWVLVGLRLVYDLLAMLTNKILYQGDMIALYQFMGRTDGFLLFIPIFFGVLFPFFSLYFVRETIKLKNTQSATGILYVILCAIVLADMAYKYYLIKFSIVL